MSKAHERRSAAWVLFPRDASSVEVRSTAQFKKTNFAARIVRERKQTRKTVQNGNQILSASKRNSSDERFAKGDANSKRGGISSDKANSLFRVHVSKREIQHCTRKNLLRELKLRRRKYLSFIRSYLWNCGWWPSSDAPLGLGHFFILNIQKKFAFEKNRVPFVSNETTKANLGGRGRDGFRRFDPSGFYRCACRVRGFPGFGVN